MSLMPRSLAALLVFSLLFLCLPFIPASAAPSGPPVRIGGTLALTGPLAPTALLHKMAGRFTWSGSTSGTGCWAGRWSGSCWTTSPNPT